jgi:two-component system chemotaxis response regulator CheB
MPAHDIVAIGASAGGVDALRDIVATLPADLPAAIFVVLHVPADTPSILPALLSSAGPLHASHATHRQAIEHGRIYVAPNDHHLLLEAGHVHVVRGPRENGFRPAVDALFRSAARAYGPRVVGVVLTGMLDDGTAGLMAIKRHGGLAIVQDPADASFPNMPQSALRYVAVDSVLPVVEIGPALSRVVHQPTQQNGAGILTDKERIEANSLNLDGDALDQTAQFGTPVPYSCPDCGGVLVEYYDGDLLRFRCQVGQTFSRESVVSGHTLLTDRALWAAFAALDERVHLAQRLARDARRIGDRQGVRRFDDMVGEAEARRDQIRRALDKDEAA